MWGGGQTTRYDILSTFQPSWCEVSPSTSFGASRGRWCLPPPPIPASRFIAPIFVGFGIPTARRFPSDFAHLHSRPFGAEIRHTQRPRVMATPAEIRTPTQPPSQCNSNLRQPGRLVRVPQVVSTSFFENKTYVHVTLIWCS